MEGFKLLKEFAAGEKFVAMIQCKDTIYIATESRVYVKTDNDDFVEAPVALSSQHELRRADKWRKSIR
jgi:hypothetical protein